MSAAALAVFRVVTSLTGPTVCCSIPRFTRPPAELRVTSNLLLVVRETGLEARGGFALAPEGERRFGFDFIAPPGWQVRSVKDQNEALLPIERYHTADGVTRIHVQLPTAIAPGEKC